MSLAFALMCLAVAVLDITSSVIDGGTFPIMAVIFALLSIALFIHMWFSFRPGSKFESYTWTKGDRLSPIATTGAANMVFLYIMVLVGVITCLVGALSTDFASPLFFVAVVALLSVAILIGQFRSKVMVQNDAIIAGIPSSQMMLRLPFDRVSSIRLRGRVLRVEMRERVNRLSPRTMRFLLLGDTRPMATIIQAIGMTRAMDTSVENAEMDPTLLKSYMVALQRRDDAVTATVEKMLYEDHSDLPDVISGLLIAAGASALLFAFVLGTMEATIEDVSGRHMPILEFCTVIEVVLGVLILAGAVMSHRRKKYGFVRTSCILAIISVGGFISTALGIIALVLLMKSADEYEG